VGVSGLTMTMMAKSWPPGFIGMNTSASYVSVVMQLSDGWWG